METEILASRFKTFLMLLISLGFVAIGVLLPHQEDRSLRWVTVFFSIGSVVLLTKLIRPQRMLLDRDGFTISGGLVRSPNRILWRDVSEFFVIHIRSGSSMIAFNYNPDAANKPRGIAFSRRIADADAGLSGAWPGSKAALVDTLNEYRARALAKTSR